MVKKCQISKENDRSDGCKGWVVVIAAFFIGFVVDGLQFSFGLLLVELLDQFQRGRAETAVTASITTGVMHLVGPFVGAICDTYGCRIAVVAGAIICCIGFVISTFATSVFYLYFSYGALSGLGLGFMYIPAGVCVIQHFEKRRTLANGIAVCGSGVGTFVFNQLMRFLIDQYGWRGALLIEAGIALQGAVLGLFLSPPIPRIKAVPSRSVSFKKVNGLETDDDLVKIKDEVGMAKHLTDDLKRDSEGVENERCQFKLDTEETDIVETKTRADSIKSKINVVFHFNLLKDYRCWLFLMSAFTFELAFTIPYNLIPDQAIEIGMTKQEAAWLSSSIGISNTISRVCVGWFGDLKFVNRLVMLEVILFLAGLSTGVSFLLTTFELKLIYTCMYGFFVGGYMTLMLVVLADLFGADMIAKSVGLVMFFAGISGFISTPLGGFLFDKTGNYHVTFIVAGVDFIIAALLLLLLKVLSSRNKKR